MSNNTQQSMPCRSCKHYTEGGVINTEAHGFVVNVSCIKGKNLSKVINFDMYGVNGQADGEAVCEAYVHQGFQW